MARTLAMAAVLIFASVSAAAAEVAEWPMVEAVVRPKLRRLLDAREVERLLSRPDVRDALVATFAAWDGADDLVTVTRASGAEVVVRVVAGTRERECVARLGAAELGAEPTVCRDVVRPQSDESLVLGPDLWAPPPARRRPRPRPRAAPPADEGPDAPPARVETVLRDREARDPMAAQLTPTVRDALADWADLREDLKHHHWTDPFMPEAAYETGTALAPPAPFSPLLETRVTANLRDPFDEARTGAKLDLPAPQRLRLSRDVLEEPVVKALTPECADRWAAREAASTPPSLDCFRRVSNNRRVRDGVAHRIQQILGVLGFGVSLPVLDQLVALEAKRAAAHRDYNVTWAVVWLEWVRHKPDRLANAARALNDEERKLLRRRLWRWWIDDGLRPYRDLISTLYERHFLALYPEASDANGLPRRAFFNARGTFLWAHNWLAEANQRPASVVVAAYRRLGPREQAIIDGFVADAMIASRFPASCAALAN